MNKFNLKEHNCRSLEFAQKAASGTYPTKKIATIGSFVGITVGMILLIAGGLGIAIKSIWGIGSAMAGGIAVISNLINLKRIK